MEILGVLFVLFVISGTIGGFVSLFTISRLRARIDLLESDLKSLHARMREGAKPAASEKEPEKPAVVSLPPEQPPEMKPGPEPEPRPEQPAPVFEPIPARPPMKPEPAPEVVSAGAPPHPEPAPAEKIPAVSQAPFTLEQILGSKWLGWVGMILTLIGAAFFLKYAYDNNWIGPKGRLAIGVLAGVISLVLGEHFRRRNWNVLFQTFSGGGIAGFYICIYFSFQIYHLSGQGLAFGLAIATTCFAMAMSLIHNAPTISILAMIGGFLSPVLLSTGENHPHVLFIYTALLDLLALGVAYFRRWRGLDLLAIVGTSLIYAGWYEKFYGAPDQPGQMMPALLYASLFFLLFLLIPVFHGLVRRVSEIPESIGILALNALYSFICFYGILYAQHREILAFMVICQAILVFILFRIWTKRMPSERNMAETLLIIGLSLVTVAVPIRLRMYGIPIAWAVEGALLIYLTSRLERGTLLLGGVVSLFLSIIGLLYRLPLHKAVFVPLLNIPFGSWMLVIAAQVVSSYLVYRSSRTFWRDQAAAALFLAAFGLFCFLLSMETAHFWNINNEGIRHHHTHLASSLLALWGIFSLAALWVVLRYRIYQWIAVVYICFFIMLVIFIAGSSVYADYPSVHFLLNFLFPFRLLLPASLWITRKWMRGQGRKEEGIVFSVAGHFLLTVLIAMEIVRWGRFSEMISDRMAISLVSAAWALQAMALVALGFIRRDRALRYLGICLFAVTVGKVTLIDMSTLEKVYRIVSFISSGLLLLLAGYCYNRFSPILLKEEKREDPS